MKTAPTNRTCIRSTIALKLRGDLLVRSERRTPGSVAEEDAIEAAAVVASAGEDG